ncbi:MAG TPA: phosphate-starvation-inducible PsiE family protein [Myxococcales bacterium]|nr:phosphate-starvation-inducible PsiE family protein [Myxococcales bacterium]
MQSPEREGPKRVRQRVSLVFSYFEDLVYIGLGLILAYSAAALLVTAVLGLVHNARDGAPVPAIIDLLDRSLLVLMVVELLYTVKVSFREHALLPEPFLVVGLIAATRRILVVTAEFGQMLDKPDTAFHKAMIEVGLLTVMVVALVVSLRLLRAHEKEPSPK